MTPTERLYYTDARLLSFSARIVERSEDGRRVYLDRTAFYPTSGGQPHDLGVLGGVAVVDVEDEGDRIAHLLVAPIPAELEEVSGEVDRARRLDHMQQHTGQHLLSALLHDLFGWQTVSVHFGAESSTVDVDAAPSAVTPETLVAAERRANEVIAENRVVTVSFEQGAAATGLRKATDREGILRVVTIEEVDRSACGGTHVRATGEIGVLLLRRVEKVKQGTRIEFVCGLRAAARARRDFETLTRVAQPLSAALDDLPQMVAALQEQLRESERARRAMEADAAAVRAHTLYAATPPDPDGLRRAMERRTAGTDPKAAAETMRALALAFVMHPKAVLVGVTDGAEGAPVSVLVAASDDSGVDAGAALREAITPAGGRGGGSSRLAQGSVPREALEQVLVALRVLHG